MAGKPIDRDQRPLPRTHSPNEPVADQLGCAFEECPKGPYIRTDSTKMATIPGVYAAGGSATAMWNATLATADGVTAGVSPQRSFVFWLAAQ